MAALAKESTAPISRTRKIGPDPWLVAATLGLVGLGFIMVVSASIGESFVNGSSYYIQKEVVYIAIGTLAMGVGAWVKYSKWKRVSPLLALGAIALLLAVLFVGTTSNGAQRWFQFSGYQFEPSEYAKIALAIYFAHWLSAKGPKIRQWGTCTVPFGMMLGVTCLLVLMQPDMGTAVVIATSMIALFFIAGARIEHLLIGVVSGALVAFVFIQGEAYQRLRLQVWADPFRYAKGPGYHIVQALIALGRGGWLGVGPGNSQQKYLLPAPFTDSIFAVTAEELGFVGAALIIGLFVLLAYRGIKIAREAPDDFGKLVAVGVTSTIVIQAFVNIAVITNTVPFTGVPLPFISYGGSSLIISMFSIGVLLNISWHSGDREMDTGENETAKRSRGSGKNANSRNRRQDRWPRISRFSRSRSAAPALVQARHFHNARSGRAPVSRRVTANE